MKILQVHNNYQIRGGECSVVNMEQELLARNGHTVYQYICDSGSINEMSILEKTSMFVSIPYNKRAYNEIIVTIKANTPDVAHVHNVFPMISPSIYAALNYYKIPIVQTLHNYRFLCPNGQFFIDGEICEDCQLKGFLSAVIKNCVRGSRMTSIMYAYAISRAWKSGILPHYINKYIALNSFVAEKMVSGGVPYEKIEICGNYTDYINTTVASKQDYILYLGRISIEKGIGTLLKALSQLEGVKLKVAGSGPEEAHIRKEALILEGVEVDFLGHIEGRYKQQIIAEALCMIVPSEWYENFPITIVESLSLGTPVVASNIGGLADMIDHGVNGLLFEAGNHNDLAVCIRTIIDNSEGTRVMSEHAIQTAKAKFGPDEHYRSLIEIYQHAINDRN